MTTPRPRPRQEARQRFGTEDRLLLLEEDADEAERSLALFRRELQQVSEQMEDRTKRLLMGIIGVMSSLLMLVLALVLNFAAGVF